MSSDQETKNGNLAIILSQLFESVSSNSIHLYPGDVLLGAMFGMSYSPRSDLDLSDVGEVNDHTQMLDLHFEQIKTISNTVNVYLKNINLGCENKFKRATLWDILNDGVIKLIDDCKKDSKILYPCPISLSDAVAYLLKYKKQVLGNDSLGITAGFSVLVPPFELNSLKAIKGLTNIGVLLEIPIIDVLELLNLNDLANDIKDMISKSAERSINALVGWDWDNNKPLWLKDATIDSSSLKIYLNIYSINGVEEATLLPGPTSGSILGVPAYWKNLKALSEMYNSGESNRLTDINSGEELSKLLSINGIKINCEDEIKQAQADNLYKIALSFFIASKNAYLILYTLIPKILKSEWKIEEIK